jgi:hypothetical protein
MFTYTAALACVFLLLRPAFPVWLVQIAGQIKARLARMQGTHDGSKAAAGALAAQAAVAAAAAEAAAGAAGAGAGAGREAAEVQLAHNSREDCRDSCAALSIAYESMYDSQDDDGLSGAILSARPEKCRQRAATVKFVNKLNEACTFYVYATGLQPVAMEKGLRLGAQAGATMLGGAGAALNLSGGIWWREEKSTWPIDPWIFTLPAGGSGSEDYVPDAWVKGSAGMRIAWETASGTVAMGKPIKLAMCHRMVLVLRPPNRAV